MLALALTQYTRGLPGILVKCASFPLHVCSLTILTIFEIQRIGGPNPAQGHFTWGTHLGLVPGLIFSTNIAALLPTCSLWLRGVRRNHSPLVSNQSPWYSVLSTRCLLLSSLTVRRKEGQVPQCVPPCADARNLDVVSSTSRLGGKRRGNCLSAPGLLSMLKSLTLSPPLPDWEVPGGNLQVLRLCPMFSLL